MDRILRRLKVRYVAPAARQLGRFWAWWTGEMVSMLPGHLQAALGNQSRSLQIEAQDGAFIVFADDGDQLAELGRVNVESRQPLDFDLPDAVTERRLLLQDGQFLIRQLTLPLVTEENLRESLLFELDRQTPFKADQVYYDCHVRSRDTEAQTLTADLVVTPRSYIDKLIDRLNDCGISPDRILVRDFADSWLLAVDLIPTRRHHARWKDLALHRNRLLVTANLVLAAALLISPLVQKQRAIDELAPQVRQAIEAARSGEELRHRVEQLSVASEFLRQRKETDILVMRTLDEITRILPENTWATQLDIDTNEIQLQGQSSSSAALIQLLEASPLLYNVRFRSPVTSVGNTEEDRFHLSAEIAEEHPE